MRLFRVACYLLGIGAFLTAAATAEAAQVDNIRVDFEDMAENAAPQGFSVALTGAGGPPIWVVKSTDGNKALVQITSEDRNFRFPLCIYQSFSARDVDVSVRFRALTGRIDQAAGVVWRYQNADNYYVVRANALENNVVLYKVENGKRIDLKPVGETLFSYGKKAMVAQKEWNRLRLVARGDHFSVWLNDTKVFDVEDNTFMDSGRVGLWTKADSVTSFDELTMTALQP
ncbi:MAG: DUF1080 domain-containing protein [Rhodospirillaceae bacterium]|nr:DUF1080 domain-containing protein [Rhodospirillaceae bacterium]